jgi:site-specific DNA-methyltransferase (adenine-specific)
MSDYPQPDDPQYPPPWKRREVIGLATLYLSDARDVLPCVGSVSHIITDPPYSARTHAGHDAGAVAPRDGAARQWLGYGALSDDDCRALAGLFCRAAGGWIVWMHDHTLAPAISGGLAAQGRYVFAPLPYFHAGRSVRLTGDGPCSWTDWITVARTPALRAWGTLPGGYVAGPGWNDKARMGGKPTALMRLLVEHYSRPGDVVCDPFMGAGTTGVAAVAMKRPFVGIEIDAAAFATACRRIEQAQRQGDLLRDAVA